MIGEVGRTWQLRRKYRYTAKIEVAERQVAAPESYSVAAIMQLGSGQTAASARQQVVSGRAAVDAPPPQREPLLAATAESSLVPVWFREPRPPRMIVRYLR